MFTEDKKQFLNDFGKKLKFVLPDGTTVEKGQDKEDLLGIFDLTVADPNLGYLATKITKPRLTCIAEDVIPKVVKNSSVEIEEESTVYKVHDITPDGTGFATIELGR